jgi:hypothetical protein
MVQRSASSQELIMREIKATTLSMPSVTQRQPEQRLFAWLAVLIVILVFVGFSRTYYLHSLFKAAKLSIFLHVHGAVMTGWIILFAVQTFLVASNHTRIHRALGTFGAGYAVLVVVMGCTATVLAARREVLAHSQFVSSILTVLALELTQMLLFASLVASGIRLRNRAGYHKRLMLLAAFCILPNPIVRLFIWAGFGSNIVMLSFWALLVAAVVLLDSMRNRRLHPAFGLGATITVAFLYLAYFTSLTPLWQRLAANAVG